MKSLFKVLVVSGLVAGQSALSELAECSAQKIQEVLSPATEHESRVELNCHLKLHRNDVVTKQVRISGAKGSNLRMNCHGATLKANSASDPQLRLLIRSTYDKAQDGDEGWLRPENVLIENCRIEGSVRVMGMAVNGEDDNLTASSRSEGHTKRVQESAPRGIVLNKNTFIGQGSIPIYFSPGVTHSGITNSHIGGVSNSVAVYFDAESAQNTLKGNRIDTKTLDQTKSTKFLGFTVHKSHKFRELVAIDGSAYNKITDNFFSSLNHGGIYLYRNCGEGGNIRHQTSSYNEIINNTFYYNKYDGDLPAIWVASRNGNRSYCDEDAGFPLGSSKSNLDHATMNLIAQNKFFKFSPKKIVKVDAFPNYVERNETVTAPIARSSGCYLRNGFPSIFLAHGQSSLYTIKNEIPTCHDLEYRCNDGILEAKKTSCPLVASTLVPFSCQLQGSNSKCQQTATCPQGMRIRGMKALCNLEFGQVNEKTLKSLAWNHLSVSTPSDHVSEGSCILGKSQISSETLPVSVSPGATKVTFSCSENDKNGGDCHISGKILCE